MVCAVYARFSSDMQRATSIVDQVARCREFAEKQGWTVLEEYVKADAARSGTSLVGRDGLNSLLEVARGTSCPFNVLLTEDTSRLGRDLGDLDRLVKTLVYRRVTVIGVADGFDTRNPNWRQLLPLKGMMDQGYVDNLRDKTHRGQRGQILRGHHAGGRCYGYIGRPIEDPTRIGEYGRPEVTAVDLVVCSEEAEVVRRIFTMYAAGNGLARIAKTLNNEGVPAPRPREGKTIQAWCTSCIQVMLRNHRYRGWSIWNQHQKVTDPESGRKTMRPRPESEWVRVEKPDWRIVSEDLWNAVQQRIQVVSEVMGAERQGGLNRAGKGPGYVFSGLLLCGLCGARLVISGGDVRRGHEKYACPNYRCRGMCKNNLYIRRDRLEAQLFGALEKHLFKPDSLDRIVSAVVASAVRRMRAAENKAGESQAQMLRRRLKEVESGADAIAQALTEVKGSRALLDKLRALEAEKEAICSELADQPKIEQKVTEGQTRQFVIDALLKLSQMISDSDVPSARAAFQRHFSGLVCTPTERDGKRMYRVPRPTISLDPDLR